jgi:hypothetical protein
MELEQLTGCQSNQLPSGVPQQAQSQLQQQQQQQQQQQEQQPRDIDYANLYNWTKQMSAAYFRDGRNWAVSSKPVLASLAWWSSSDLHYSESHRSLASPT